MRLGIIAVVLILLMVSCSQNDGSEIVPENPAQDWISAVDISSYPEISESNAVFYDLNGNQKDFLSILKENSVNTVRLRLWVNPTTIHSGFNEVKQFSTTLKSQGFKVWITLHYSDTWADPGQQVTPAQWQSLSFTELKDQVYDYTKTVIDEIAPEYIQIGNEINSGFLHPQGNINANFQQFRELLASGIAAVRENSSTTQIILHYAGLSGASSFFNQLNSLDYDIIGVSYYPIWHGKELSTVSSTLQILSSVLNKPVLIAETAYPFTLDWNDWTNNIIGLEDQIILPEYPATEEGQQNFIRQINSIVRGVENGIGFCYWGAELIAWKGNQATDASPWENQALFDFENNALPVLEEFSN